MLWAEVLHGQNFMDHRHNLKMTSEDMKLRSACKVTSPEWCLSGPFKKSYFYFHFLSSIHIKTLSIDSFVVYQTYDSLFFVGFFYTLEANITRRCWRRWWFLCKAEVGWPLSVISTHVVCFHCTPVMCAALKRNKSSCRNGSPPDFLCLWSARRGSVLWVSTSECFVHVFTCPVRWSRRCALVRVKERVY